MSIIENKKVFGDPTYDVTFKMLFGNNKNKDLAISLINNLLNFHDEDQVNDITFLSVEIPISCEKEIKTIIDMRCITNKGEEIIVEMQRLFHNLVLPRTQYYMAKSISYKMSTGESDQYHIKLAKTYLLMISRQNLFKRSYQLKDDIYYEKTAVPIIKELDVEIPGNLMVWKFYEIEKFSKMYGDGKIKLINNELPIKEQWLNFFDKCGSATEIPDNVDDIIKKAYRQMEMYKWPKELEMIYDMAEKKESLDLFYLKESILEGEKRGQKKGQILSEIKYIKDFIDIGLDDEMIIKRLRYLTHIELKNKIDVNMKYIREHLNESDKEICEYLGLFNFFDNLE